MYSTCMWFNVYDYKKAKYHFLSILELPLLFISSLYDNIKVLTVKGSRDYHS